MAWGKHLKTPLFNRGEISDDTVALVQGRQPVLCVGPFIERIATPLLLHREMSWSEAAVWYQRALNMDSTGTANTVHSWVYRACCFQVTRPSKYCVSYGWSRLMHQTV